jgi:hypothetical protein
MTETTEERRITVRPSMALANRNRPRGLWGQITTSLLRPALFFRTLAPAGETRQWLWAAILVLALVGIASVRYSALSNAAPTDPGIVDPGFPPDMGGDMGGGDMGGGIDMGGGMAEGGDFGGIPPGGIPTDPNVPVAGTESTLTADLTMALLAAANVILGWIVLTVMLIIVPMLRGRAPRLGQNLQIAVWSSLPFAVMAIVQLLYWSSGGKIGEPGVQGLLADFPQVKTLDPTVQALLISFTSRLTVFWLWSLMLVYFGARFALSGWRIVAFLVVIAWALIQIGAPVVTGAITAQSADETPIIEDGMGGEFPIDGEMPVDGGEFPPDMDGDGLPDDPSQGGMIPPESTDEARPDQNFEILDGHGEQEVPDESGAQETPAVTEPETEAEAETTAPASESPTIGKPGRP